jgi:peptidoglycan/xylan/chitin deacetylase (PgdA/CDA1 family)
MQFDKLNSSVQYETKNVTMCMPIRCSKWGFLGIFSGLFRQNMNRFIGLRYMQFSYLFLSRFSRTSLIVPEGKRKGIVFSFDVETWDNKCGGVVEPSANPEDEYFRYLPGLLELFRDYSIPAHFFVCGKTLELYPEVFKMVLKRGHAIGGHGYAHERMSSLSSEEQRGIVKKVRSLLNERFNLNLTSWRCPYIAANRETYKVLNECDVKICSNAPWGKPMLIEGVLEVPMVRKMDDQILRCNDVRESFNHPKRWADYMKGKFKSADSGIMIFGMHTWIQRKYDPKHEALTVFLNFLESHKNNARALWFGRLDDLCETHDGARFTSRAKRLTSQDKHKSRIFLA